MKVCKEGNIMNKTLIHPLDSKNYPIFKVNKDGFWKFESEFELGILMFGADTLSIGGQPCLNTIHCPTKQTLPYDKEKGLYHLQPCWGSGGDGLSDTKAITFFNYYHTWKPSVGGLARFTYKNLEPITAEQLRTMPFIFDMCKELLTEWIQNNKGTKNGN